ncbi:HD domain-containing protein [Arcobacteraceae bacterium]|nr:HD domain-containing protein [Arcobacteraceae bacterium]
MTNLNIKIEELIESKAPDFQIAKEVRSEIKQYLSLLDESFKNSSGKDFLVKHTKKIDGFIKIIYKFLLRKHFGSYLPMTNYIPITIIALGSYGREQLCVYSDIDIMLLYDEVPGFNIRPILEEFVLLAWDSGLKLGSRVHSIDDIEHEVKSDVTIKTSILESRLIYGSKHLWYQFEYKLMNIRKFEQKEFVLEKLAEHKTRLLKYPLCMQPNIKDGYGGMREANMVYWMANITFGVTNSKHLCGIIFTEEEFREFVIAIEYIFRVRSALHLISKKKVDIVTFDNLPELSRWLGYRDTTRYVKERQCMARILKSLHTIHAFSAIMTKKITRRYLANLDEISNLKKKRIAKNLYYDDNNKIYTSFNNKPKKLNAFLKELISLPHDVKSFDPSYVYYSSQTILPLKLNEVPKSLIVTILEKENLYPIIKLLYNSSLLIQLIPTLKMIINQPQFDGYHTHPVDVHSMKTLYHIQNIKDPFLQIMYKKLNKQQKLILRLASFFHDVGKGRGKDHHVVGQNLFKKFAKSLNLDENTTNTASILIRYHNMMSKVATTEDIYSQNTILAFTGLIKTQENLELLYLLTYADICSVDDKLYKSSTASLLKELYLQSMPAFDNKELLKISSRRVAKENTIKKHKLYLESTRLMKKKILHIESNQMYLKYKAEDIIKIAIRAKDTNNWDYTISNKDRLAIKITRAVPLNLGYLLGKMQFLNIVSMGIYKLFDDKKFFEISFDSKVDEEEIPFIEDIIKHSFDMTKEITLKKPIISRNEIIIDCNHTEELAIMKINTKDQKGLFSYIAKMFDEFGVEINSAKIQSLRGKAKDLFLISKNGHFCDNKNKILDLLTKQ